MTSLGLVFSEQPKCFPRRVMHSRSDFEEMISQAAKDKDPYVRRAENRVRDH